MSGAIIINKINKIINNSNNLVLSVIYKWESRAMVSCALTDGTRKVSGCLRLWPTYPGQISLGVLSIGN
jgi:hypothetical protein